MDLVSLLRRRVADRRELNERLVLRLVLRRLSVSGGVHVGAGVRGEPYLPVLRVKGRFYIPPSSVKGALRRLAESLALALAMEEGWEEACELEARMVLAHCEPDGGTVRHVCYHVGDVINAAKEDLKASVTGDGGSVLCELGIVSRDAVSSVLSALERSRLETGPIEPALAILCPLCDLLGGPGLAGRLRVFEVSYEVLGMASREHVGLRRATGTAYPEVLFSQEVALLDSLRIGLVVDNPRRECLEPHLLAGLIEHLTAVGLFLGSSKSRGLGWFRLDPQASSAYLVDLRRVDSPEKLARALALPEEVGERLPVEQLLRALTSGG